MSDEPKGKPFLILFIAVIIVASVSLLPLSRISGGKLNDFNLIGDILPGSDTTVAVADNDNLHIDKELIAAIEEQKDSAKTVTARPQETAVAPQDSIEEEKPLPEAINPRSGDIIKMEDYSPDGNGLARIKAALAESGNRLARIAVIGDSYIEGDIFTQNVREKLQDRYGGGGVGYVNMYSEFPGFRRSVRQSGSGWTVFNAGSSGKRNAYISITEQYSVKSADATTATATYKGVNKYHNLSSWGVSRFVFVSPQNTVIRTKCTDDGWETHEITGSPEAQCIEVSGAAPSFSVSLSDSSVAAIGVWLDEHCGVSVDCMSSRGFSGVTLTRVNEKLSGEMRRYIDYDLIILEFGINAMSASQRDYSAYSRLMVKVINHIRQCYPNADIVMMGVGDRGQKTGSEVKSMAVTAAMVNAQRTAARTAGCVFWDTREAMGGEGAIIKWASAQPPLANKDYVHLSHAGGARLAEEFVKSFVNAIEN